MATEETNTSDSSFYYCEEKTTMKNDPWTPLPPSTNTLLPTPKNPLYEFISTEDYLESLNKRLQQIRQQAAKEPSAKDILNGLALKKSDIMKQFLEESSSHLNEEDLNSMDAESLQAFLMRRLFPERHAIYTEELVTLIQADELAKAVESQELNKTAETGLEEEEEEAQA